MSLLVVPPGPHSHGKNTLETGAGGQRRGLSAGSTVPREGRGRVQRGGGRGSTPAAPAEEGPTPPRGSVTCLRETQGLQVLGGGWLGLCRHIASYSKATVLFVVYSIVFILT